MASQKKEFLSRAHLILNFGEDGKLENQGSYQDLKRSHPELLKSTGHNLRPIECKTAQERWKLLKNVTKLSIRSKTHKKIESPKPASFQKPFKRLESSAQLGFCHNIMIHSPLVEEELESTQMLLRRMRSTKMKQPTNLAKIAIHNEHKKHLIESRSPSFSTQETMMGFQFAHKFVSRMTSNSSQLSGVSGFSDDQDEDFENDGLITHHDGSWEEEEREKGHIKSQIFKTYFKSGGWINFALFMLFSIGFQSSKIYTDFLLKNPSQNFLMFYLSLTGLALILSVFSNIFGQRLGAEARKILHMKLLNHVIKVKPYLFEVLPTSRFVSRLAQDTFIIDQKLPSCFQRMSLVTFICIGAILVNVIQSPIFLAFALPLLLFYWAIQHFYRKTSIELQRIESSTRSPYLSHLSNTLCSLVTLRAFKEQSRLTNQFCDHLDANTTALLLLQSGSRWLGVSLDMAGSVIVFASVISCLISFDNAGETFGLALNYSLLVPIYLAWVIKFLTEMESCLNAVERVIEYTQLDYEEIEDGEDLNDAEYDVRFQKVSLSHGDILRPAVHNVNFEVKEGQKLALVGRSGSGKSTIINCFSGMSKIVQGDVFIGGISIFNLSLKSLRTHVKTIPQNLYVFNQTIKEVLDPNQEFKEEDISKLLEELEMKNVDLNDQVEDSKSFKQQLVIAQALLAHPKILILDEATSALDDDRLFTTKLFKICKRLNITLISVVHRLSNINEYDRILVIGDGRVLEDGKPLELLKKPMGFFSSLYRNSL